MYVEVILDEGVKKMKGGYVQMQVLSIRYTADRMQIYIKDYRPKAKP